MDTLGSHIVEQIEEHVRSRPAHPALVDRRGMTTFGQMWDEISSCARLVEACGVGDGDAVGVLLPNSALFVAVLLGIAKTGCTAILLPASLPAGDVRGYCRGAGAGVVLAGPEQRELLRAAGARPAIQWRADLESSAFDAPPERRVRPGDFIGQLTSGVDQPSKVAVRTQAAVWSEILDFAREVGLTSGDISLVVSSIAHSYGLIGGTLAPLCQGGCAIVGERFTPEEVARIAREERPTLMFGIPVVYRGLLALPGAERDDFASLRLCLSAGAPLPRDVDDDFAARYEKRICQDYGSTEVGVITMRLRWRPHLADSVGRPVRGRTVTVVDAQGQPLPPGQVGEVVVESRAVARCYLPESNPALLHGDRFTTGDLGWFDDEGNLFLRGRKSSVIRTAAAAVDPAQVEAVIAQLPEVREVAVVGVPEHCRRYLVPGHVPEIVEFCERLPRTPAGKVLRRFLRTPP
jgi:long-chain acyl-CoA synthetase